MSIHFSPETLQALAEGIHTKPNPNAYMIPYIKDVRDWVVKQGDRSYHYLDRETCAMAQYHKAHGQRYGGEGNWPDPTGRSAIAWALENMAGMCSTFSAFRVKLDAWLCENEPAYLPLIQP